MDVIEFFDACGESLRRAEAVVRQPIKLQEELVQLEELLRREWPNAVLEIKESGLLPQYKDTIDDFFQRITKIESVTKANSSLFDGLEVFMQRSNSR
jgi:hypothetical protein